MRYLKLFGGASIESPEGPVAGRSTQRRRLAILSVLAATPVPGGVSRDKLIALLWPESDAERGRHLLSDSIYRINQELGAEVIRATGSELRLNPELLPTDVGSFQEAVARRDWAAAISRYAGPFLDGFFLSDAPEFESWVEERRGQLARDYARSLEALAEDAEAKGDWRGGADVWRKLANHDRHNSRVACRLMEALDKSGGRAAALQHARIFDQLFRDDLGLDPDPVVKALADRLKTAAPVTSQTPGAKGRHERGQGEPAEGDGKSAAPTSPAAAGFAPARSPRRGWIGILVPVAVLVAGGIWYLARPGPSASPTSVAVLPFADLSGDRSAAHLSDGIAEEILSSLARVDGFKVASRTSSAAVKAAGTDVREIGRRLGVKWVLEGSFRQEGQRLRVSVRLIDAGTGYHVWTEDYDRELGDAFAIQREVARSVVARLRGRQAAGQLADAQPADFETYNLYLKGRFAWHQRTEASLEAAVGHLTAALARMPDYAPAHAALGDGYAVLGFYDYLPPAEAFPKARAAAERALAIDPSLAAPHATLGYAALYYDWKFESAEREFQQSIALDPSYSTAHQWYANLLTAWGRFYEAEREMREAQVTDPLSLIANAAMGWVYYYAGAFDKAIEQCRRTLDLNADFELAHLWMGQALGQLGRRAESFDELRRAVTLSNRSSIHLAALAFAHAGAGDVDSTRALLSEIEQRSYVPAYEVGKVYVAMGDKAQGLHWLRRALNQRSHSIVFLKVDPELASVRGDPGIRQLIRDAKLP